MCKDSGVAKAPQKELFSAEVRQNSSDLVQNAISLRVKAENITGKMMGEEPAEVAPDSKSPADGDLHTTNSHINLIREILNGINKTLDRF